MKFIREKIDSELERLRNKNSYTYNPGTGELINPRDLSNLSLDVPDLKKLSKNHLGFGNWEPTDAEMELADDLSELWNHFNESVIECLQSYCGNDMTNLFTSFKKLCESLNELWQMSPYDWETQKCVFTFMKEIETNLYTKIEPQLWFCMYANSQENEVMADILKEILNTEFCMHHPYPGYYKEQAQKFIKEMELKDK